MHFCNMHGRSQNKEDIAISPSWENASNMASMAGDPSANIETNRKLKLAHIVKSAKFI